MNPGPSFLKEDFTEQQHRSLVEEFKDKWGLEPGEAQGLAKNRAFLKMLKHLDHVWMEYLREDSQHEQMLRHQGAARIVGDMLHMPDELEMLMSANDE